MSGSKAWVSQIHGELLKNLSLTPWEGAVAHLIYATAKTEETSVNGYCALRAKDYVTRLQVKHDTITRAINSLHAKGLLEYRPDTPVRSKLVRPTSKYIEALTTAKGWVTRVDHLNRRRLGLTIIQAIVAHFIEASQDNPKFSSGGYCTRSLSDYQRLLGVSNRRTIHNALQSLDQKGVVELVTGKGNLQSNRTRVTALFFTPQNEHQHTSK